jgi:histidine triad (HIT) family protein
MCVFCQIVAGEIPAHKIDEDETTLSFLDIYPVSAGHILVIPKSHYTSLDSLPAQEAGLLIASVQRVGRLMKEKLQVAGYNVIQNNDVVAGQVVPHVHFHLIPRRPNDGLVPFPSGAYQPGELEAILTKLIG